MGVYMGPISAIHKGVMWDVQRGSILDPHGQTHIGHICIHVGSILSFLFFSLHTHTPLRTFYAYRAVDQSNYVNKKV